MKNPQGVIKGILAETFAAKNLIIAPTALVEYCNYDHVSAVLCNQILYWSPKATRKDGWFYKRHSEWQTEIGLSEYQVRRCLHGDPRSQNPRCVLTEIGIETRVKLAYDGKRATYYRVDWKKFFTGFLTWVSEAYDMPIKKLTRNVKELMRYIDDLGAEDEATTSQPDPVSDVPHAGLDDFAFRPQQPEPLPTSERVNLPWELDFPGRTNRQETISDAWQAAQYQMKAQFGPMYFDGYLRDTVLVDYDPQTLNFTLATPNEHQANMLGNRLYRIVQRVLSDAFGQEASMTVVTQDDWRDRHR